MSIRIGTRASNLAMWQATAVLNALTSAGLAAEIVPLTSQGDRSLGGQLSASVGQFIHSIDDRLLSGEIDIAVHSSKDVPVDVDRQIRSLAYLERGVTDDLVLMRKTDGVPSLEETLAGTSSSRLSSILDRFEHGATFGTVSGRRQSFLLSQRPDIIPLAVRGHVETRLERLLEGRVDAVILAEVGLKRLDSTGALDRLKDTIGALRIAAQDWPTAPGQGAVVVHCAAERLDEFQPLQAVLDHLPTRAEVETERRLLQAVGGGCLFPAGIGAVDSQVHIQVSPKNWREIFCQGVPYTMFSYSGALDGLNLKLPEQSLVEVGQDADGPRFISTLNSDRISFVLANNGIPMQNLPVVELSPKFESWPHNFLEQYSSKRDWPYLVLTSPFAAKCAVQAAEENPDIGRIPWVAIGEGTARACFRLGVTVAVCAMARNAEQLVAYLVENFPRTTTFLLPRSNLALPYLEGALKDAGFPTQAWIGYQNVPKTLPTVAVSEEDVLLLSSASSAVSWAENRLNVPREILCMGENARRTIASLDHFDGCNLTILKGPTSQALIRWWNDNRGEIHEH